MKILVTGGGTGGHVYPAISIANEIRKKYSDADILFVGTSRGLENDVVPKAGYDFKTVTVKGFRRKLSIDTIKTVHAMFKGFFQSGKIIKEFAPDVIVGTGGYVTGPVVLQGALRGVKTIVHEQNAIPGVTIKLLSKFVNVVLISYDESINFFKRKDNLVVTGNPVRDAFSTLDKDVCKEKIGIDKEQKLVFITGGSGGAKTINETALDLIEKYNANKEVSIIHVTGKAYYDTFIKLLAEREISISENIQVVRYAYNMPEYMKAADIMLSRAGALTLSEIAIVGVPSILIPSPNVAHNHQEHNAQVFDKIDAAVMVRESEINDNKVFDIIESFIYDDKKLKDMHENALKLGKPYATAHILEEVEKFI